MPTRRKSTRRSTATIHVLHVEIAESQPSIWRELQVPSSYSLNRLHHVLQAAFGWEDYHLHMFENPKRQHFGVLEMEEFDEDLLDEADYTVADLGPRIRSTFSYIYDYGDDWLHNITVKAIQPPEPGRRYPACVDGARSGPREDSGGIHGYQQKLEVVANRRHPEREELLQWLGESFDPDEFDVMAADAAVWSSR